METRHLRYFLAVAETGSLTRAAETLGVAQPALSQALVRMEGLLGVKLFTRSRRGAELTVAGQAILEDARLSLARIDAATEHARLIGQGIAGRLTIAFVATASLQLLPEALYAYRQKTPRVEFILREMTDLDQVAALEAGTIDVGLLYTPIEIHARMKQRVIARYRMVAAVREDFPVGADGKVSLADVARGGLVLFGTHEAPALRAAVLTAIRKVGEHAEIVQEASRTTTVLACVAAHCGSALVSSATARVSFPGVRYAEVREVHMLPTMELSAVWPARSKPMLADNFVDLLPSAG
ncbi:MAG: LysR family transcriptional regulator [Polaromonas sp.]|uniref:LysR substrate-binding domain-containing protein n=1 Tax=Polaromonas sp. TaxID=1869339 RepID=UPI0025E670D4|nr:LysR family transcriptional regulator [Polaromonas sp.]MBI2727745.1 LysR family transcriptional regulator [Polaromonas sp.]